MTESSNALNRKHYALGWDYSSPRYLLLKYLHAHPDIPFHISAIVHDRIYVTSVDGIPLITTEGFLGLPQEKNVLLLSMTTRTGWAQWIASLKAPYASLVRNVDTFVRQIADELFQDNKSGLLVGTCMFPDIFNGADILLLENESLFSDDISRRVYRAYRDFLRYPHSDCFVADMSPPSTNAFDDDWFVMSGFDCTDRPPSVVELTDGKPIFAGEFLPFMGPRGRYYVVADHQHHQPIQKRANALFGAISPNFQRLFANLGEVPDKVWQHPETVIIVNKALTKSEHDFLLHARLLNNRIIFHVGASAVAFQDALNLSNKLQPAGTRRLRINGRYPNSLYLFSAGQLQPMKVKWRT